MSIEWFVHGWGAGFGAYAVIQVAALIALRGRWRVIAAIPLPLMVLILVIAFIDERRGSNLWDMGMILFSPGAALGVLVVWIAGLVNERRFIALWIPIVLAAMLCIMAARSSEGLRVLWSGLFTLIPGVALLLVAAAVEVYFRAKRRAT